MPGRKVQVPTGPPALWVRVCNTIDGFRLSHGRWPTRVRLGPAHLAVLVTEDLSPIGFALVSSVVEVVADERGRPTAEDGSGAEYAYGREEPLPDGHLGVATLDWFGRGVLRQPWE